MKRFLIAAAISIVLTLVFVVLAGMGGGACHCNTPNRVLFPFEAMLGPHASGTRADLLLFLQCPAYVFAIAYAKGDWKVWVGMIVLVVHVLAAALVSS